jgi:hypothetical protein
MTNCCFMKNVYVCAGVRIAVWCAICKCGVYKPSKKFINHFNYQFGLQCLDDMEDKINI